LKGRHVEFAKRSFSGALVFATIASLAALVSGHFQAKNVYRHQPAKLASFEGHFETGPADMSLFGIPDAERETIHLNVAIPGGLSFLIHEDFSEPVVGLDRFRPEDRPPLLPTFASYHVMISLGMTFIALTLLASFLLWRGRLYETRWLLWCFVFAVGGAMVANQLGWVAAEVGRQPWIVHPPVEWTADGDLVVGPDGVVEYDERVGLRTVDAVSPSVSGDQVLGSIIGFGVIYLALGAVWLFVLDQKIRHGPEPPKTRREDGLEGVLDAAAQRPARADSMTGAGGNG
jgi:cytochrome d ubiquinol oxidase subunit I